MSTANTHEGDRWVLAAAALHGLVVAGALLAAPAVTPASRVGLALLLGLLMNWGSNTVSHIHLHTPLFRTPMANQAFSLYLTALLGVPQRLWTSYHLRHHGLPQRPRSALAAGELLLLAVLPLLLLVRAPAAALVWAAGVAAGYGLCALQGHGEHAAAAAGVDRRGRLYNRLCFNDGFHAAHHRAPTAHWSTLPAHGRADDVQSVWPPVLRWLPAAAGMLCPAALDALERLALRSARLQRFMLATHEQALRPLLARAGLHPASAVEVLIVGGGLHPRSALVLQRLLPAARLTILDRDQRHLDRAAAVLSARLPGAHPVRFLCATFDPAAPPACDVLVVPLAFRGDRQALFRAPPAPVVLLHDWLWRRGGVAAKRVSWLLAKRLVLLGAGFAGRAGANGGNVVADRRAPLRPWPPLLPLPPCCPPLSSNASAPATRPPS